ncbi:MAG: hypothetical protein KIT80_23425 [Chitinophagaceae bacterium]|nr:hypothetical protein [Nitrosomonas sp.]MCW5929891.1 hypothetical protein [Chitinophagaceae bacterium]
MRVVLYADQDMEPITVIELSEFAVDYLNKYKRVTLPVIVPMKPSFIDDGDPTINGDVINQVNIYAETLIRKGQKYMILFTQDEESALLLKSCFLPGQRSELNEEMANFYAKGVLYALGRLGHI